MNENQKWSQWKNIGLRTDSNGRHYLLQMRTRFKDGKVVFKNRSLDSAFGGYILFHGQQLFESIKKLLNLE